MNHPIDDEHWAPGREAIEREKDAARNWLDRNTPPLRGPARPARWAAAGAGIVVLFLGALLLRQVFHSGSAVFSGTAESIRKVIEMGQSEGSASPTTITFMSEAAASETAWSIQRVICAVALDDAIKEGLPRLIESALVNLRKGDEARPISPDRAEPRPSPLSEIFLRFYQSIKEG
jgi:hypothetical protein